MPDRAHEEPTVLQRYIDAFKQSMARSGTAFAEAGSLTDPTPAQRTAAREALREFDPGEPGRAH
ncbi:hypothetical protein ACFP1Z_03735 [Streptomyces gamaensis]|uniref:Uncharacterized protein n=1 Tax=Streptomyces gamaensis TaxID=1763542 RepID=A0ABW0YU14_9ACTN